MAAAVIVANGPLIWTDRLTAIASRAEPLLAADGGANALARIGLAPERVVGDLDSILPTTRRWLGEDRLLARPDQDHTDLEKTLAYAFSELGLTRAVVLGALGARIDQTIHNLGLLARYAKGPDLVFRGHREIVLATIGELELDSVAGETWSFFTFDPGVTVSIRGVRWPVTDRRLDPAAPPSTSNEAIGGEVTVVAEGGPVLIRRELL